MGWELGSVAVPHQESDWVLGWREPEETRPWPPPVSSLYWKHIGHEPYDIKHGRFSVGEGGDRFAVLERCATQDNPNGCITNSTQDIRYREEQQFKELWEMLAKT